MAQTIEERDLKEIKSKSRLIVKEFEGLLNLVSNNQMYDSEIQEIISNSFDENNANRLFKNEKVIVEDDINPDLSERKRNVEITTYLSNFNLQYNKTSDFSVSFDDIEISELYNRDYFFVIATLTRNFSSTYSKDTIPYSPLTWNVELEIIKNDSGKWLASISGFTNSAEPDFLSLDSFKVDVLKSSNPMVSLASSIEETETEETEESPEILITEAAYDEEYYSFITLGEKAFSEERYDDAYTAFEAAKNIKNYDSYSTLMLGRSKRLNEVQVLNSKENLIDLYSRQAFDAERRGDIEIALKRYANLYKIAGEKVYQDKVNTLEKRLRAKEDVVFFLSLPTNKSLIKELEKKAKGKNKNVEYDLGKALLMQKIYSGPSQIKDLSLALSPLEELLKREPDFIRARLTRSKVYNALGDYGNSLNDLSYLISKNPNDYPFYIERGKIYLLMNLVDNAIQDFLKASEINPIAPAGHFELGKIYLSKNNKAEAEYHFKQCISAQYSDPTFHYFYALSLKEKDFFKYLDHLKIAREFDGKQSFEIQIEKELAEVGMIAENFVLQNELEKASSYITKALEVNSNSVGILISNSIFLKAKKQYSESIPILERLLTMNSNSPRIKYELADNYSRAGRFDQSLKLFTFILSDLAESKKRYLRGSSSNPNVVLAYDREILKNYVGLADLYFNNKKFNEAIEYYTSAKEMPDLQEEYFIIRLAQAYFYIGDSKEALSTINYGLKLNPNNFHYYYLRGEIYFKENDFKNSITNFTKAATDPKLKDDSNFQLALLNYIDRKFEQTFIHLKQVGPTSKFWEYSIEYGALLSLRLNYKEEENYYFDELEKFYANFSSNKNKYFTILVTKDLIKNNLEAAETKALELLKNQPNNSRLLYSMAMVNLKNGKEDAGVNYLDRCLRTNQLYEADLYIDPEFEKVLTKKVNKLVKDYFK